MDDPIAMMQVVMAAGGLSILGLIYIAIFGRKDESRRPGQD